MVNLLTHLAPDGTPVLVNQVDGRPSDAELQKQADAARDSRVVVDHTTGKIRRQCDGTILRQAVDQE